MKRVVLAEDSGLLRESLAAVLTRQGFEVVAECDRADALPGLVTDLAGRGLAPDIVVTDVRMPPTMADDGLVAAAEVRSAHPGIGILVCSQYVAPAYARTVFQLSRTGGGVGYLLKDSVGRLADFVRTLNAVAEGSVVIDPQVATAMVDPRSERLRGLTGREREVLTLMAHGLSNGEIAARLVVSGAAVAKHVASIFTKLGLRPEEDNRRVKAILAYLFDGGMTY
ncbi:MAG: response regulator transcription factor [Propionibacteriaceae bacterium]|nr:response regulator transcription factor [Propionibacteriaceae bacterium]